MSKKQDPKKEQAPTTSTPLKEANKKTEHPKDEKTAPSKDPKAHAKDAKGDASKESKIPELKVPKDNVLVTSGLLEAYEYLQKSICKHGFPKGNVFEYAAAQVMKYEKKFKAQKAAKLAERLHEVKISMQKSKSPERGVSDHPGLHDDKKDKKDLKKDGKKEEAKKEAKKEEHKKEEAKKDAKKEAKKEELKKEEPKKEAKKEEKKEPKKEEPPKKETKKGK